MSGVHVFKTPIGPCGIAWHDRAIDRLMLPEDDADSSRIALLEEFPDRRHHRRAPAEISDVARRIRGHLKGNPDDLRDIKVDYGAVSAFSKRLFQQLRRVPPGQTITYGGLAERAGSPGGARAAGRAVGANRIGLIVPCHRVIGAGNTLGGFTATGGLALKTKLLHAEGVNLNDEHARGIAALRKGDPVMRRIIDRVGPYLAALDKPDDPYETLVTSIVHQQISMAAARTIGGRLIALGRNGHFPAPRAMATMPEAKLRAAGVSRQKITYLRDLARSVESGALDLRSFRRADDEGIIEALTQVRGLGRWSAQMFLMFSLGRLDVLPTGDLGLRAGVQSAYGMKERPSPGAVEEFGERWRPYRSMATWYLWRGLE